jgi:hypothetical protein
MPAFPKSSLLLKQVARRISLRQLASWWFRSLIILSVVMSVLLLTGRLTGLFPDWFRPWTIAIVPVFAFLVALLVPRRVQATDAARLIDRHQQAEDLFLTLTTLGTAAPDYAPLVVRDAEAIAENVKAQNVVRFHWENPTLIAAATLGALFLGAYFVPTLDPFGKVASARQVEQERKLLEESRKETEIRKAQLARKDTDQEHSEEVDKALEALKTAFQQQKKGDPQRNLQKLNARQKEIGEMYRKLNSGELKPLFEKLQGDQQLGQMHDQDQFRQWQKELQQGSSEGLKEEFQKLQESMQQLAQTKDPLERTELERKLQKQLKELSDFAATKTGSKALNAALQRAIRQLEAARQNEELSQEALQALQESLELAQKEMQSLAQSARDLKQLEEALKLISMAKQCKGNCPNGEEGQADRELALSDYAELYAELMQQYAMQQGNGEGTGGEGQGGGAKVDEDDSVETGFVDEKSKSAIQKGKILLSMKSKGLSEAGEMKDANYKQIVGEIKQSLDDVITQEEIPPGYIEGIKKYFDTLEKK